MMRLIPGPGSLGLFTVAVALAAQAAGSAATGVAQHSGLCGLGETVYFSCNTGHGKQLALCGQSPQDLQYRYGKPGQVELAFPEVPASGPGSMSYASYRRFRVQRQTIRFIRKGAEYTVFDYQEEGSRRSGVSVLPAGATREIERVCVGPVTSRLHDLKQVLPCDAESALQGGSCP